MAKSSYVQDDFRGGFFSPSAQGKMSDPEYKRGLAECYNSYPIEPGAWVRRPPFMAAGYTRFGAPAKLLNLASSTKSYYNMEVSAGHFRFMHGSQFVVDATTQSVSSITNDNPALCTTNAAHGWATGDMVVFDIATHDQQVLLASLTTRVFLIEVLSTTTFLLHNPITGLGYDGSSKATWDSTFVVSVSRVTDVTTPYNGDMWKAVKRVQTDKNTILLHPAFWPRVLTYDEAGAAAWANAKFVAANFLDGPYLDAQKNSVATPSALSGDITLTFSYGAYDATKAYETGDYVTSGGFHWRSLSDDNLNHSPVDGSAYWTRTSALDWVKRKGLFETDIGRHVRIYSEPPDWAAGTTYANGNVVKFAGAYWMAIQAALGAGAQQPGAGTAYWVPYASGARWTWGKITAVGGGVLLTGTPVGDMTAGGGLAALFDGTTDTQDAACAQKHNTKAYAGLHLASPSAVTHARLWPGRNAKIAGGSGSANVSGLSGLTSIYGTLVSTGSPGGYSGTSTQNIGQPLTANGGAAGAYTFDVGSLATAVINLRAKGTAPASASDGTLLGTSGSITYSQLTSAPISIPSNDGTTTWSYVWFEIILTPANAKARNYVCAAEAQFYSLGVEGDVATVKVLGDPLLYTGAGSIRTWQLGLFNNTDPVYPKCGCYHEGRVWFGLKNQFIASRSNDVFNMAPTGSDGTVGDSNSINYKFNSEVNADILWMLPTDGGIVLGMGGGERLLFSTVQDQSMTPTNINVELKTSYGSYDIEPAQTPLTSAFVHANGRDVHEYMRDAYSGRFVIPPLTENSKSLTNTGIAQVCYMRNVTSIIWAVTNDGRLIGTSYERRYLPFRSESPPAFNGWHHHEHGAPRDFISVSVGPSVDGSPVETLAVVTQDRETGLCRIEVAGNLMPENNDIYDCNFLDGRFVPTGGGVYVASNPTDTIPPDPPPPAPKSWKLSGWHLVTQCPALNIAGGPTGTVASPVDGESMTYLTPPTSMSLGLCSAHGFTALTDVPGYTPGVFPASGASFCIGQYFSTTTALQWKGYQLWAADDPAHPAPIGSGPAYS